MAEGPRYYHRGPDGHYGGDPDRQYPQRRVPVGEPRKHQRGRGEPGQQVGPRRRQLNERRDPVEPEQQVRKDHNG